MLQFVSMLHEKQRFPMVIPLLAAAAIGIAVVCHPWDLNISLGAQQTKIPGDLRKAIHLSETFAHASGCIMIFGALLWIDIPNRKPLWRAAAFVALCGIAANAAKYFIPRYRPHSLGESETPITTAWETWGVPGTGSWFDEQIRSFPSGHSATAVALAIGLTQVYPRGRWIFASMAAMACLQRLVSGAHYLSDILGGVLITLVLSLWYWKSTSG